MSELYWTVSNCFSSSFSPAHNFVNILEHSEKLLATQASRVAVAAIRLSHAALDDAVVALYSDLTFGRFLGGELRPVLVVFNLRKGETSVNLPRQLQFSSLSRTRIGAGTFKLVYAMCARNYVRTYVDHCLTWPSSSSVFLSLIVTAAAVGGGRTLLLSLHSYCYYIRTQTTTNYGKLFQSQLKRALTTVSPPLSPPTLIFVDLVFQGVSQPEEQTLQLPKLATVTSSITGAKQSPAVKNSSGHKRLYPLGENW